MYGFTDRLKSIQKGYIKIYKSMKKDRWVPKTYKGLIFSFFNLKLRSISQVDEKC